MSSNKIPTINNLGSTDIQYIEQNLLPTPNYQYGPSQQQLDYEIALRNKPKYKYCFATTTTGGSPVSRDTFTTNDVGMSKTNGQITITEDGMYSIDVNSYQTQVGISAGISLLVNGASVCDNFLNNAYLSSYRQTFPTHWVGILKSGDVITVTNFGTAYTLTNWYLRVFQLTKGNGI